MTPTVTLIARHWEMSSWEDRNRSEQFKSNGKQNEKKKYGKPSAIAIAISDKNTTKSNQNKQIKHEGTETSSAVWSGSTLGGSQLWIVYGRSGIDPGFPAAETTARETCASLKEEYAVL